MRTKEAVTGHPGRGETVGDLKESGGALPLERLGSRVAQANKSRSIVRRQRKQGHGELLQIRAARGRCQA
jgi:hypothetical protein